MNNLIRVLIADDHTIVRAGVRLLLDTEPDIAVVGEAVEGSEAVQKAISMQPNVVLMDVSMPGMDGIEATRRIKAHNPDIHILVLTMHRSDEYFFEMLQAGASGYIIKGAETEELIRAIHVVADGDVFLYPSITGRLVREYLNLTRPDSDDPPALSPREREVMHFLAEGYSNKEIAQKLVISLSTVYTHRSKLMEKLGLTSRHDLVQYARRTGIIHNPS